MSKKIVHHLYHCHLSGEGQDLPPQFEALLDSSEVQAPSPQRAASPGDDDDDDDDVGNDDDDDDGGKGGGQKKMSFLVAFYC